MLRYRTPLVMLAASLFVGSTAFAQSNNPDFRLNNRTGITIQEVYVSSSRNENWGRDRLGDHVLPSGQSLNIVLPAGQCTNDIRVVFESGASQEKRNVNTCGITDFNFTR
ncbi:hypothetical protein [Roseomonas xinghualingensis]|uniref:hypothetical protein n=1 Tax=Roseomonas xinghualingensis TaxID=2986475 RepID=UPI0021F0CD6C|nr:hypothetical protein [Roseomonas sp. SXEYE001]MCV4206690.1 hypothetical protein [Roseomonas sp. SXEYE001]